MISVGTLYTLFNSNCKTIYVEFMPKEDICASLRGKESHRLSNSLWTVKSSSEVFLAASSETLVTSDLIFFEGHFDGTHSKSEPHFRHDHNRHTSDGRKFAGKRTLTVIH